MECGDPQGNLTAWNAEYVNETAPESFTLGTETTVICKIGYQFSDFTLGPKAFECLFTASWSSIPICNSMCICLAYNLH